MPSLDAPTDGGSRASRPSASCVDVVVVVVVVVGFFFFFFFFFLGVLDNLTFEC